MGRLCFELGETAATALDVLAERIDDDLPVAGRAMQDRLVGRLQADLADLRGARVRVAVDVLEIFLADCTDVAERVHGAGTERIPAGEAGRDFHAGKVVLVHGETTDLLVAE